MCYCKWMAAGAATPGKLGLMRQATRGGRSDAYISEMARRVKAKCKERMQRQRGGHTCESICVGIGEDVQGANSLDRVLLAD